MNEENGVNVIIGRLDTKEMVDSINKLVSNVNNATKEIGTSFQTMADQIKSALGSITQSSDNFASQFKNNSNTQAEGARKVAQANKDVTVSYDDMANAQNRAMQAGDSSTRSFLDKMRTYYQELQRWSNFPQTPAFGQSIINKITSDLQNNIPLLKSQIQNVRNEIERLNNLPFKGGDFGVIERKRLNQELEMYTTLLSRVSSQEQQSSQTTQRYTEDIRRQAEEIRNAQSAKNGYFTIQSQSDKSLSYVVDVSEKRKSIEEQLLDIQKKENDLLTAMGTTQQTNVDQATRLKDEYMNIRQLVSESSAALSNYATVDKSSLTALQDVYSQLSNAKYALDSRGLGDTHMALRLNEAKESAEKLITSLGGVKNATQQTFSSFDSLRSAIAHVLGIEEREVHMADTQTASLKKLEATLRDLRAAYAQLSASERNSENGRALLASIHEVERAIQKIKQEASRPVSLKNALGLDEHSISDIRYKLQQLNSLKDGLNLNTQKNEFQQVQKEIDRLNQKLRELNATNNQVANSNNLLGRSFQYIKNRIAFYLTVGATTNFVKQLIDIRGQYEMTERSLQILVDSAERGTEIFRQLGTMAMNSPFTTIELTDAARQLSAMGFEASELVGTVKRLGDISAAVGAPIDRIAYALGQVQTYGYLTSLQARTFMRMGIPIVKSLADEYSRLEGRIVSTNEVMSRMKDKAVSYNDVMNAINRSTDEGGRFFDYQAKVANTLKVQLSNLSLAWQNMLNDMGKSNQGLLTAPIKLLKTLFSQWNAISRVITSVAVAVASVKMAQFIRMWAGGMTAANAATNTFGKGVTRAFSGLGGVFKSAFTNVTGWITLGIVALVDFVSHANQVDEKMRQLNEDIRNNAKEASKSLQEFLDENRELEQSLYKRDNKGNVVGLNTIDSETGIKMWEEIKRQITETSSNAQIYIAKLEQIEDVTERVSKGFDLTHTIQEAIGALDNLGDKAIKVNQDTWLWGTFGEGMTSDLKDYVDAFQNLNKYVNSDIDSLREWATVAGGETARLAREALEKYDNALREFQDEVRTTTNSIIENVGSQFGDFSIAENIFNPQDFEKQLTEIMESSDRVARNIAESEKMTSKESFEFRRELNNQLYNHYAIIVTKMFNTANESDKERAQEMVKIFNKTWQQNRVSYDYFLEWMKNSHYTMVSDMYNDFTKNGAEAFDVTTQEGRKKINELLALFKKNNENAYHDLLNWVNLANMLNISIPVLLDIKTSDDRTGYEVLEEYDRIAEDAYKKMERNQKRITQLKAKGNKLTKAENDELDKLIKENAKLQEKRADAISHGGESKTETRDVNKAAKAAEKARKKAESDARKAKAAADKAAREAEAQKRKEEQELQGAIRDEISLVENLRKSYQRLRNEGIDPESAYGIVAGRYNETLERVNKSLQKYGVKGLDDVLYNDIIEHANDPKYDHVIYGKIWTHLKEQLEQVKKSGRATTDVIKALEEELAKLLEESHVSLVKYISNYLSDSLKDVDEKYQLSLEIDSNPELGGLFADMLNVNFDELLQDAPRTFKDYMDRINELIEGSVIAYTQDMGLKNGIEDLGIVNYSKETFNILDDELFKKLMEAFGDKGLGKIIEESRNKLISKQKEYFKQVEKMLEDYLSKYGDFSDKVRSIEQKRLQDMKALNDAYAGNENKESDPLYKRTEESINRGALKSLQKQMFEDFKGSDLYLMMFEDMEHVTTGALDLMLNKLQTMRSELNELDPTNLKTIISLENKIFKERATRSPFKTLIKDIKEYNKLSKTRKDTERKLMQTDKELQSQKEIVKVASQRLQGLIATKGVQNEETIQAQETLDAENDKLRTLEEQVKKLLEILGIQTKLREQINGSVSKIGEYVGYARQATEALVQVAESTNNIDFQQSAEAMNDVVGNVQAAIEGFKSGGWVGAVAAGVTDLIPKIVKWMGNQVAIEKAIQRSEREYRRLDNTIKKLQYTVDGYYGALTIGANNAIKATKELQLVELERQLILEQSRKKKYRDKDKIIDLQGQIIDLRNELDNATKDIVNDLLGISGGGGWAEDAVNSMIEAFKNGEDAIDAFMSKWDEMVDHMIMKYIVSTVMQQWWDKVLEGVGDIEERYTKDIADEKAKAQKEYDRIENMSKQDVAKAISQSQGTSWQSIYLGGLSDDDVAKWKKTQMDAQQRIIDGIDQRLNQASIDATEATIDYMMGQKPEGERIANLLYDKIGQYFTFGENADKELSALQQGIQGITEDTAGALEAYMNSVSQQVYLQSDLLTQINLTLQAFDFELQSATNAEILLSLQQSYQVQMAIQTILMGWSSNNGMSVRVEMV